MEAGGDATPTVRAGADRDREPSWPLGACDAMVTLR